MVSPEYLTALSIDAVEGRRFLPEESEPGRGQVALLGYDFFQESYGGDPGAVGASLVLDGERYEVVGVLPQGFDLPSGRNEIWIPATMDSSPQNVGYHWGMGIVTLVARMHPGATPEMVRLEVLQVQDEVRQANPLWTPPPDFWSEARVVELRASRSKWARTPILVLLGAVAVVLLVVCANVANLLLSRGLARQRDFAVRTALGAGRRQLALTQLVEVGVLAVAGTALGLVLAGAGLDVLRPVLPADVPGIENVGLDLRVIVFTALVAMVGAVTAGVVPAMRVGGRSPQDFLRESGRGRSASRGRRRVTGVLVAGQMAAAVVLVTGAGLLARSLQQMSQVDPGFETEGRVVARIDVPPGLGHDQEARALYYREIEDALETDPAIRGVGLASSIPFGSESEIVAVFIVGVTDDPNNLPTMLQRRVSGSFFDVAGIPLLSGRLFDAGDRVGSPLVVVADQSFAEQYFPGQDPVGRIVRYPWRGALDMEIVGVVGATRSDDLAAVPTPTLWFPLDQMAAGLIGHTVVVATTNAGPEPPWAPSSLSSARSSLGWR